MQCCFRIYLKRTLDFEAGGSVPNGDVLRLHRDSSNEAAVTGKVNRLHNICRVQQAAENFLVAFDVPEPARVHPVRLGLVQHIVCATASEEHS